MRVKACIICRRALPASLQLVCLDQAVQAQVLTCGGRRPSPSLHPQAAAASVTRRDLREVGRLSVQQLAFCGKQVRSCLTGWTMEGALKQLTEEGPLLLDVCLPWAPDLKSEKTRQELCSGARKCGKMSAVASKGQFSYIQLNEVWMVLRHIRQYGAVITRWGWLESCLPRGGGLHRTREGAERARAEALWTACAPTAG